VKPWTGVLGADHFSPICPQRADASKISGVNPQSQSEDCLYLNIWTPAKTGQRLPVMVWIHGGGFVFGAASLPTYDGENLARKGVVLVSINYRLGALGFMLHPALTAESPHHTSGNYGLLDQIAALKWIKANIAAFGGDPGRVTIFGESAGSDAVNMLQASPLAKGLFQQAIGESTAEMDPAAGIVGLRSFAEGEQQGVALGEQLHAASIAALRAVPAEALVNAKAQFWPMEQDNYVLPRQIYAVFAAGRQNKVPILVGSNSREASTLPMVWVKPDAGEQAAYSHLYAKPGDPQATTDTVLWQMRTWVRLDAKTPGQHAWLYWFDHAPPAANGQPNPLGAFHASEIIYVFNNLQTSNLSWSDADRRLADQMSSYWTNFAKTGDPNGPGLPPWPAYSPAHERSMRLADDTGAIPLPHKDAVEFIDAYFAHRRAPGP
jgi:para-nitrobenzyl esterase